MLSDPVVLSCLCCLSDPVVLSCLCCRTLLSIGSSLEPQQPTREHLSNQREERSSSIIIMGDHYHPYDGKGLGPYFQIPPMGMQVPMKGKAADDGYATGFTSGFEKGKSFGWSVGRDEGKTEGFNKGFEEGKAAAAAAAAAVAAQEKKECPICKKWFTSVENHIRDKAHCKSRVEEIAQTDPVLYAEAKRLIAEAETWESQRPG